MHPTSGSASLFGTPVSDYHTHNHIGYLAENHRFPPFLSAQHILYHFGRMNALPARVLNQRIPELLQLVELEKWRSVKIRKYSKGMMQRLGLAHALINDPPLVFLDEPTDGIDPVGRRSIRDILKRLRDQGKTIFLNSHLLSEVERLSDHIGILKNGKMIRTGSVAEFTRIERQVDLRILDGHNQLEKICRELNIPVVTNNDSYRLMAGDTVQLNRIIDYLRHHHVLITAIVPGKMSLEDYFIKVVEQED